MASILSSYVPVNFLYIDCSNGPVLTLDNLPSVNLRRIDCSNNSITSLDISENFSWSPVSFSLENIDAHDHPIFESPFHETAIVAPRVEVPRKAIDNDDCPICLENMNAEDDLSYCRYSCGKSLHTICFNEYTQNSDTTICVYCRATW